MAGPYLNDDYRFSTAFLSPLVMSDHVPEGEGPTPGYISGRLGALADLPLNFAAVQARWLFDKMHTVGDYDDLFILMPKPTLTDTWRKDRVFAEQRLSGVHPNWLRIAKSVPANIQTPLDQAIARAIGPKASAASFLAANRLFIADYGDELDGIPSGTWEKGPKYLVRVCGYFIWRDTQHGDRGELFPIGIYVEDRAFVTPFDPGWQLAKVYLQTADAQVHEMRSHLYMAHFCMEPIAVATGRYLNPNHPIRTLLDPHLRFLLFNNDLGKSKLVNPGGFVDRLLASSIAGSLELVKRAAAAYDFTKCAFPNDVAARGVDDVVALPHYPYRDDGQLLWDAIGRYAAGWVENAYGKSDAKVVGDVELNRWWDALGSGTPTDAGAGGAKLQGIPAARTLKDLAFILQHVIFTGGPYHSAVNYPQYEYMAYVPNMPLALYAPWPDAPAGTEGELLDALPPNMKAVKQLEIIEILSSYRHDALGHYSDPLPRAWQTKLNEAFRRELDDIEKTIGLRNRQRRVPYKYLMPSLITNSTSV